MDRIKFSQSFISFIEQTKDESKVSKYLHHYIYDNQVVTRHIRADKINYLTFRKNGAISYLPFGRELKLTDNGEWSRDGRQEGKPAKTITQIMRGAMLRAITNRDLEIFSNLYKGQASDLYTFKVASGEDLRAVYNLEVPFTSCMNGAFNSLKLDLYVKNPDKVSVVYIQTGNTCQARALLWTDNEGNKILDRVYGSEEFRTMFRDYAKEIGAWKKVYDGAGHSNFFNPEGEAMYKDFYIEVDADHDRYPYVDTFCYLNDNKTPNILTNSDNYDATKKLQNTDGAYEDLEGVECYRRSDRYSQGECVWSDYHDCHIHEDDSIYVGYDYYYYEDGSREDAIRISRRSWVLVEDCEEVECINKDDLDEGIIEYDSISTFTCYKLPNGELMPTDDADIVEVFVIDGEIMGEID